MKMTPTTAREVIDQSDYAELPETVLHANLCIAFARLDRRSVPKSLREFAKARIPNVKLPNSRVTLEVMATSHFPETEITRLKACISKMESVLARELRILK